MNFFFRCFYLSQFEWHKTTHCIIWFALSWVVINHDIYARPHESRFLCRKKNTWTHTWSTVHVSHEDNNSWKPIESYWNDFTETHRFRIVQDPHTSITILEQRPASFLSQLRYSEYQSIRNLIEIQQYYYQILGCTIIRYAKMVILSGWNTKC